MQPEIKQCQNCTKSFTIEVEDFEFYTKMQVPPPTWCPQCRLQRRLAWMAGIRLWKRKCDKCGENKISMYSPSAPYKIYCDRCWWEDDWDAKDYGQDIDWSRPFLEQWRELLVTTPILGLSIDKETSTYSPYTNHCGHAKNCYMIFYSDYNEDSMYGYYLTETKSVMNCGMTAMSEKCFDTTNSFKNSYVIGSNHTRESLNCTFLRGCDNCTNCFGSANLRGKSYVFFNEQLTKEEYKKRIAEIDLGSYTTYCEMKEKAREHWKNFPPRSTWDDFSQDCSGNYVFQSKNCKECYEVFGAQDSKYLMLLKARPVKDSYDYTDWGENVERIYECMTVGSECSNIKFCHESGFSLQDVEYSKLHTTGRDAFGCVSIRKTPFCILNKQYSEEEYRQLIPKIKKHMLDMPYTSPTGIEYRYGEFFPLEFSPHAYNNTFAQIFFPSTQEKVTEQGLVWDIEPETIHTPTITWQEIPDHIKDSSDSITQEIISCKKCSKGFRIVTQELSWLQNMNLPLPRECPFCRVENYVASWKKNITMVDRVCNKCDMTFPSSFTPEEQPIVWCKKCYLREII